MTEALADRRRWICPVCQKPYLIPPEVGDPTRCAKCEKKDRRAAAQTGTIEMHSGIEPDHAPGEADSHSSGITAAVAPETSGRLQWHVTCAWCLSTLGVLAAGAGIAWGISLRHLTATLACTGLLVALLIWQTLLLVLRELRALTRAD